MSAMAAGLSSRQGPQRRLAKGCVLRRAGKKGDGDHVNFSLAGGSEAPYHRRPIRPLRPGKRAPIMSVLKVEAAVTAIAAVLLVCTTAFAAGVAMDLAVAGWLHLPWAATAVIGALIVGADGWLCVWLFRNAYAVEKSLGSAAGQTEA